LPEAFDLPSFFLRRRDPFAPLFALQHANKTLAKFFNRIRLCAEGENRPALKETQMSWKTPKIVEVPVGMEINMYACAARK
jgi:coenzyme PQQ precursor peptide PqqA